MTMATAVETAMTKMVVVKLKLGALQATPIIKKWVHFNQPYKEETTAKTQMKNCKNRAPKIGNSNTKLKKINRMRKNY